MRTDASFQLALHAIGQRTLDPAAALDFVSDPGFGGIALFVGRVRNANRGRDVTGVSYSLFAPLVMKVFERACREAAEEFGPRLRLHVSHAHGRLGIGDLAVVVAAGTPHRDEAFRACRKVIEIVKHESPIWKKEHYSDGDSEWSEGCSLCVGEAEPADPVATPHGHGPDCGHAH